MKKLLLISSLALSTAIAFSFSSSKKIVVIDAGHGGVDHGVSREGILEKDVVWKIAQKIKNQNPNENLEIIFTREGDTYPSLADRTSFINKVKPDLVVSLHVNSVYSNSDRKGVEVYVQENEVSRKLGEQLSQKFDNARVAQHNLYILKNSQAPALLLEVGFMSNADDREYISSEKGQTEIANRILDFLVNK